MKEQIDLHAPAKDSLDFKSRQREAYRTQLFNALSALEKAASESQDPAATLLREKLVTLRTAKDLDSLAKHAVEVQKVVETIEDSPKELMFKVKNIPSDVKQDVEADLKELDKCFDNACYRSAVILCGRLLETALHRKYFEATGVDLLEKAPGTGLGNLIAKLSEKGVKLDPGLTNQIHLINQIRVHSVHKKRDAFQPSKNQAQAMILYTLDVLEKLFR